MLGTPSRGPGSSKGTTTLPQDQPLPGTLRLNEAEEKMRRALGLDGAPAHQDRPRPTPSPADRFLTPRPKRRFVADGEVPVDVVHRPQPPGSAANRAEAAEHALGIEREARERAERALAEAQTKLRDLQTKIGHAELAAAEAHASVAAERQEVAGLRAALESAEERASVAAEAAEEAIQRLRTAREEMAAERESRRTMRAAQPKAVKAARGKQERVTPPAREQRPVKWWLSSKSALDKATRKRASRKT